MYQINRMLGRNTCKSSITGHCHTGVPPSNLGLCDFRKSLSELSMMYLLQVPGCAHANLQARTPTTLSSHGFHCRASSMLATCGSALATRWHRKDVWEEGFIQNWSVGKEQAENTPSSAWHASCQLPHKTGWSPPGTVLCPEAPNYHCFNCLATRLQMSPPSFPFLLLKYFRNNRILSI